MAQRYQQHEGGHLGEVRKGFLQVVSADLADLGLDVGVGFFQTGKDSVGKEHGMNKCVEVGMESGMV